MSSRAKNRSRKTGNAITKAVRGVGAKWVRQTDRTYDVTWIRDTLKNALTTKEKGPKIIVASSECMLNKQRREKPLAAKAIADGKRVVKRALASTRTSAPATMPACAFPAARRCRRRVWTSFS